MDDTIALLTAFVNNLTEALKRVNILNDAVWALLFMQFGQTLQFIAKGLITAPEAIERLQQTRLALVEALGNDRAAILVDQVIRLLQPLVSKTAEQQAAAVKDIEAEMKELLEKWPTHPTKH